MKIKNINPQHDNLRVAALGGQLVRYDDEVDVPAEVAAVLLVQESVWQPIDAEATAVADASIPAYQEMLKAASEAVVAPDPLADPDAMTTDAPEPEPEPEPQPEPESEPASDPASEPESDPEVVATDGTASKSSKSIKAEEV